MRKRTISITILILLGIIIICGASLGYVVLNFTPRELGPASITFWFVGVLIAISSLLVLISYIWKMRKKDNRLQPRKSLVSSIRTAVLLGFTATLLLALSSLNSLSVRDIVLFFLTVLIIELYFRTRKQHE